MRRTSLRHGTKLKITVYDPSGEKARGFLFDGPGRTVRFIADDAGQYRVEVAIDGTANDGPYTITVTKVIALTDRLSPAPVAQKYESQRIKALRAALDGGQANAVANFWDEVKSKGTPLIEPLPGDDKNMLATFLWERNGGNKERHGAMRFHLRFEWPDDYRMSRLGETDVWFRTIRVDKRKRFIYQLVPNAPPISPPRNPFNDPPTDMLTVGAQVDPLNPKHFLFVQSPDAPKYSGYSIEEMPDAPAQPWESQREGVPSGKVEKYQLKSDLLKNERDVYVYTPPGYSKNVKPDALAILFDADAYFDDEVSPTRIPAATILDNPLYLRKAHTAYGRTACRERPWKCPATRAFLQSTVCRLSEI